MTVQDGDRFDEVCQGGCNQKRQTRYYRGMWLCVSGPNCWRRRKSIHKVDVHIRKKGASR